MYIKSAARPTHAQTHTHNKQTRGSMDARSRICVFVCVCGCIYCNPYNPFEVELNHTVKVGWSLSRRMIHVFFFFLIVGHTPQTNCANSVLGTIDAVYFCYCSSWWRCCCYCCCLYSIALAPFVVTFLSHFICLSRVPSGLNTLLWRTKFFHSWRTPFATHRATMCCFSGSN